MNHWISVLSLNSMSKLNQWVLLDSVKCSQIYHSIKKSFNTAEWLKKIICQQLTKRKKRRFKAELNLWINEGLEWKKLENKQKTQMKILNKKSNLKNNLKSLKIQNLKKTHKKTLIKKNLRRMINMNRPIKKDIKWV